MDMTGTVVLLAVAVIDHAHVRVLRIVGGVIALLHNIGAALDPVRQIAFRTGLAVGTVHALAVQIYIGLHFEHTLFVLFVCTDSHR